MKIVLIGFMGAGKSTISRKLARQLNFARVDTDDLVVEKAGKTIEKIYLEDGEDIFRQIENNVCEELENIDNVIISTGGGVVMNNNNYKFLKNNGIIIELYAPFQTILKRISPKIPRPLFKDKEKARELYEYRLPLYQQFADKRINTDRKNPNNVVDEIIKALNI